MKTEPYQQHAVNYGKGVKGQPVPEAPARKGYKDGVCALCQEGMEGEEAQGLLVRMYCNNNRFCDECKLHHTCVEGYLKSMKLHVQKRNGFDCPQPGCNGRVDRWSVIKGGSSSSSAATAAAVRPAAAPQARKQALPAGTSAPKAKPRVAVNLPPPPEPLPVVQGQVKKPAVPTGIPGAEMLAVEPRRRRKKASKAAPGEAGEGASGSSNSPGDGAGTSGTVACGTGGTHGLTWEAGVARLQQGMTAEQYMAILGIADSDDEWEEDDEKEGEEEEDGVQSKEAARKDEQEERDGVREPRGTREVAAEVQAVPPLWAAGRAVGAAQEPAQPQAGQAALPLVQPQAGMPLVQARVTGAGAATAAAATTAGIAALGAPNGLIAQLEGIRAAAGAGAPPFVAQPAASVSATPTPATATTATAAPLVPQTLLPYTPVPHGLVPGSMPVPGFGYGILPAGMAFPAAVYAPSLLAPATATATAATAPPAAAATAAVVGAGATGQGHALLLLQQMQQVRQHAVGAVPAATAATAPATADPAGKKDEAEGGEVEVDDLMALLGV